MTIINFMPVHRQAPVALWLLKKDVAAAAEKIAEAGAQAVLMPAGCHARGCVGRVLPRD